MKQKILEIKWAIATCQIIKLLDIADMPITPKKDSKYIDESILLFLVNSLAIQKSLYMPLAIMGKAFKNRINKTVKSILFKPMKMSKTSMSISCKRRTIVAKSSIKKTMSNYCNSFFS